MTGRIRGGRLFRKYVVVLLVLVGGGLMASSLVGFYFSYRETQRAIVRVERAKAAAARIEQLLREIEQQVRETTRIASDDPDASQMRPGSATRLAVAMRARLLDLARGWEKRGVRPRPGRWDRSRLRDPGTTGPSAPSPISPRGSAARPAAVRSSSPPGWRAPSKTSSISRGSGA